MPVYYRKLTNLGVGGAGDTIREGLLEEVNIELNEL